MTVLVAGRVQGVGYRAFARRHALALGLVGHTENLPDGRVEVVAEGDKAELEHYLHLLQRGPVHAQVQGVEVFWAEAGGLTGFYVY